ncbi:MAG: hypothetical protein SFW35_01945 [Chitinophagales bacterium]|nr:hypothetical protein [Chitinophagales bacterium]
MKKIFALAFLVFALATIASAQNSGMPEKAPHQIFMNDTIRSVQKVVYADDSTAIRYRLSDDGTAIYLMDYDGKRSVKVYFTDKTGLPTDVSKPHCHIHDRIEL